MRILRLPGKSAHRPGSPTPAAFENYSWHAGRVADQDGPRPAEILETTLRPGDVLYVPRGFAHLATGDQGLSAHLSLTIREVGAAELTDTVRSLISDELQPAARPLGEEALLSAATRLLARTVERLAALTPADLLARTRARGRATMPPTPDTTSFTELAAHWPASPDTGSPSEPRRLTGMP
ncbi:JmjC domain-containing protein [Streptomyces sp. DT190]|uniref:JmjC domain-containing protein n=1 Tax=unclassified Streptomyces TaxID=2593676 RepID=UPI003CEBCD63